MINSILTQIKSLGRSEGLAEQVEAALLEFQTPADWDQAMRQWSDANSDSQAVPV